MKKLLLFTLILFIPCLALADHFKINPSTGKLDNTGPFLAGTLSDGKTCTYTSATGTIDCNTSGSSASAAGGTSAVQYNSGSSTFAGDATKFSFNGTNVGIGTSSGLALLSINSSAAQDLFRVDDSAGSDATPFLIDQTGNVGIGTATPQAVLSISSTLAQTLFRVDDNGSGDLDPFIIDQNGNVGIGTTNTERDRLLVMGGNVGIGTWVPSTMLDVAGTIVTTSGGNLVTGGNIGIGTNILGNAGLSVMGGNVGIGTWVPVVAFQVNGNVGINTLSPGAFPLEVAGNVRFNSTGSSGTALTIKGDSANQAAALAVSSNAAVAQVANRFLVTMASTGTASNSGGVLKLSNNGSNFAENLLVEDQTSDPSPFVIDNSGNVGIGTMFAMNQKLAIVGNIGIGTVKDGDTYLTTAPPNGGMLIEGNVGIGTTLSGTTAGLSVMNGNVGIGTWVPAGALEIEGGGNVGIGTNQLTSGKLIILGGNVGIGTWVTGSTFQVRGGASIGFTASTGAPSNGLMVNGALSVGTSASTIGEVHILEPVSNSNSGLGVTNNTLSERIWVDSGNAHVDSNAGGTANLVLNIGNGNVGIGTSNPISGLSLLGNVGIGTISYSKYLTTTAPSGGMIIEGNVGIGTYLPSGRININGNGGTLISQQTTAPTVASNDCGSTAQGTVVAKSTDLSGSVTVGTLAVTSCAVSFNGTFNAAPNCLCQDDSNVLAVRCTATTTKLTIVSTASMSNDVITWFCPGNS